MTATSPTAIDLGASNSPGPPALRRVCTIRADLGPAVEFETAQGVTRAMFPIIGGAVQGAGWSGAVMPGGADFATRLPDGAYDIAARYMLRLDDGTPVLVTNAGRMQPMPDGSYQGRTRAVLEAPAGPFGWLCDVVLYGTAWAEPGDEARVFIELWQAEI